MPERALNISAPLGYTHHHALPSGHLAHGRRRLSGWHVCVLSQGCGASGITACQRGWQARSVLAQAPGDSQGQILANLLVFRVKVANRPSQHDAEDDTVHLLQERGTHDHDHSKHAKSSRSISALGSSPHLSHITGEGLNVKTLLSK